jgi:hypothetical protein
VTERIFWHHQGGAFSASFQAKTECQRQGLAVVSTDPARKPVRLGFVEVDYVHYCIIDEAATHAARGVGLSFHLLQPRCRIF